MKKLILSASFAFALLTTSNTFAQQGFGTNQPDKSAAVDIVSSKRGLLIPRIDIPDLNNAAPVNSPATSLFVYNTNTASGVGFYYWDGSKWVRFTSTNNERDVVVQAAANGNIDIPTATYDANGVKTYNVSVKGGEKGQVLVSNATGGTVWVNPEEFVKDVINATNGLTYVPSTGVGVDNIIKLGGTLTENTVIGTVNGQTNPLDNRSLTIAGLETVTSAPFVMVMNNEGLLQKMERSTLLDAKDLTLGDGLAFETGIANNDGVGAVLKATKLEIKDKSVLAEKLDATGVTAGYVATVNNDGTVTYQTITPASLTDKKTLTGDGITVTAGTNVGTDSSVADALLADVTLGIANGAVTTAKLADGAVTNQKLAKGAVSPDKMTSFTGDNGTTTPAAVGQVPVADGSGNVTYQNVATAIGQDLTTDGKIVIGDNTSTTQTLADAVLVATQLSIKENSLTAAEIATGAVTSDEILNGTIQTVDMQSGGNSKVLVTAADGTVSWIDQSALGNKDAYTGVGAINIAQDTTTPTNANGGLNYNVSVATATGTTLGVVKEAATAPTVNIDTDGELSVNRTHTLLAGDVTGPLSATVVGAIQGTAVSATAPTTDNNVLVYNGTAWTPTELTGSHITGAALTSSTLNVSNTTNTALLEALTLEIKPGTTGQVLTTTGAVGSEVATWAAPNSLVAVDNGLKKVTNDVIHLGGALKEVTQIEASATNTLAISGLQPATEGATNKVVVSEGATGILRTVERVVQGTNEDVATNSGYSFFTPEVVLNITLPPTGDVTVKFPAAASAVGQVINIKIANTTESHTGYLNVLDTYGSMPYQGWIVKSNGSAWVIVGRN